MYSVKPGILMAVIVNYDSPTPVLIVAFTIGFVTLTRFSSQITAQQ